MSRVDRVETEEHADLDKRDRRWLDERLVEYRDLLTYLREH